MRARGILLTASCAVLVLLAGAAPAQADRALLSREALHVDPGNSPPDLPVNMRPVPPPPEGEIEGACGLAVTPGGGLYVSDHYHRVIDFFNSFGIFESPQISTVGPPEGPCGLALDSTGALYVNIWQESVLRLKPSALTIDTGSPTGIALDAAGDLYVDDRTYVAEYAAPIEAGEEPVVKIGLGNLGDAFGLAVSASGDRLYVPDAAGDTVKVFEPAVSLTDPVATIKHDFVSLREASVAIDPTNDHLLVVATAQPGFVHPEAAIYEFDAAGAFLGQLPGEPVHGEPSGIAVDPTDGSLYVTDGNDEGSNVFAYSPYFSAAPLAPAAAPALSTSTSTSSATPAPQPAATTRRSAKQLPAHASEVSQRGLLRVSFSGEISPRSLPRRGAAPVTASLGGHIATTDGSAPPRLKRVSIAINRYGRIDPTGLPVCRLEDIQPSTSVGALQACRSSLIGEGRFSANVKLPQQSPFPAEGKVLAFNGAVHGRPVIFAHVYGTDPVPTSYVLPFSIDRGRGVYGTVLETSLPQVTGDWGYVTGLTLRLGRRFAYRGHAHSYISASCPAPKGFPGAVFPLMRISFDFGGGPDLSSILTRNCKVR
jgi:DNA-binding beta-propeller fold protein YncE